MKYEVIEIELYEGEFISRVVEAINHIEAMVLYYGDNTCVLCFGDDNDSSVSSYVKDHIIEVRPGEWKVIEENSLYIIREVK